MEIATSGPTHSAPLATSDRVGSALEDVRSAVSRTGGRTERGEEDCAARVRSGEEGYAASAVLPLAASGCAPNYARVGGGAARSAGWY